MHRVPTEGKTSIHHQPFGRLCRTWRAAPQSGQITIRPSYKDQPHHQHYYSTNRLQETCRPRFEIEKRIKKSTKAKDKSRQPDPVKKCSPQAILKDLVHHLTSSVLHHPYATTVRTHPSGSVADGPHIFFKTIITYLKAARAVPTKRQLFSTAMTLKMLFPSFPARRLFHLFTHGISPISPFTLSPLTFSPFHHFTLNLSPSTKEYTQKQNDAKAKTIPILKKNEKLIQLR